MEQYLEELDSFIADWTQPSEFCRKVFVELKDFLLTFDKVGLEFHLRPGVTYSLRGVHRDQAERALFVMIDVIDADPRWLSVCFYGQAVTDPEERGDYVPGGLLGEDGICFDLEDESTELFAYIKERIVEAYSCRP